MEWVGGERMREWVGGERMRECVKCGGGQCVLRCIFKGRYIMSAGRQRV